MGGKRRRYTDEFKTKVALEAIKEITPGQAQPVRLSESERVFPHDPEQAGRRTERRGVLRTGG